MNVKIMAIFNDRRDAGKKLAQELLKFKNEDVVIYALPRGGVPVAYEAAKKLEAPLDIFTVRKLGVPGQEELAFGAIASEGVRVLNKDVIKYLNISDDTINEITEKERGELERREKLYRGTRPFINPKGKTAILIDDGLATGASMRAAINALKELNPGKIVVAVPTSSPETCADFENEVDEIICAITPESFRGVGQWYVDFSQTSDKEVRELLISANEEVNK